MALAAEVPMTVLYICAGFVSAAGLIILAVRKVGGGIGKRVR